MKRKVITFAILVLAISISKAQPNGGFENWHSEFSYENPDNWQTLNFLSLLSPPNPLSAFKAIGLDKHSGNYALKLKTVFINNNPSPAQINDTTCVAFTGIINPSPFSYRFGFPYTGRPEKLEFWSKYIPVGNDTAGAGVVLFKRNGASRDTVAAGGISILTTTAYTVFKVNLTYFSLELPDTASIVFGASKDTARARVGSTLFIDDVLFTGSVGIDEQNSNARKVKVFPNPTKGDLNIYTQFEEAVNVKVVDSSGKLTGIYKIQNNNVSINTSLFAAGIYFYDILDKKDKVLLNGKFNVVK